jgi:hypothetical protein
MRIGVARAGVGVRAGRDASGQVHRAIVLQKFASPSVGVDKDEATSRPRSEPGRVLITPRSEVRFREQTGKHVLILMFTAFDPSTTWTGLFCCYAKHGS